MNMNMKKRKNEYEYEYEYENENERLFIWQNYVSRPFDDFVNCVSDDEDETFC